MPQYSKTGTSMLENMIALRKEAGITQQDIADHLNVSKTTVVNFETGIHKITLERYEKVMEYIFEKIN